jgi:6-phosphogluconolactonase
VNAQKGWRITLTPQVINSAWLVVFLVTGSGKAAVLKDILEGPYRPDSLPAQVVRPAGGELLWMLDRDAAALLKEKGKSNS